MPFLPRNLHDRIIFPDPPTMPYIEGYTEGETVKRGQQLDLTCRSRGGNPPPQIFWYKNNERISSPYRNEGHFSENVLSITAKAQDNNARYRCEVFNIMSVEPLKVHVDLTVLCKYIFPWNVFLNRDKITKITRFFL